MKKNIPMVENGSSDRNIVESTIIKSNIYSASKNISGLSALAHAQLPLCQVPVGEGNVSTWLTRRLVVCV